LAVLLSWLSLARRQGQPWQHVCAWLGTVLVCGAAFAGLGVAGTHGESPRTFVVLWALFAAQAAVLAAVHALLSLFLYFAPQLAEQVTLLMLGFAVTALFWSREPIQMLAHAAPPGQASSASRLAEGVLKLSPPLAVASVWHQESDAARWAGGRSRARFDLIRAPLTYELWIGSYQPLPYPAILPSRASGAFVPGIVLAMLLWGLPLLVFGDILSALRRQEGQPQGSHPGASSTAR
ncbi:MAG: hypothetical protein NTW87_33665, partial [Planctomycetota bacterium]|nr:hypothetical protein [Planctomycetota bacterium]